MPNEDLFSGTGYFRGSKAVISPAGFQALGAGRPPMDADDGFFFGDDPFEQTLILVGVGLAALYLYYRKK